jgi:hypothetical protein
MHRSEYVLCQFQGSHPFNLYVGHAHTFFLIFFPISTTIGRILWKFGDDQVQLVQIIPILIANRSFSNLFLRHYSEGFKYQRCPVLLRFLRISYNFCFFYGRGTTAHGLKSSKSSKVFINSI